MKRGAKAKQPFEVPEDELRKNLDYFVDSTITRLSSYFLVMPRGTHFVEYSTFQTAFDDLRAATKEFHSFTFEALRAEVDRNSLILVALRTILGLSPPEFAHLATLTTNVRVEQNFARTQDQKARSGQPLFTRAHPSTIARLEALIRTACELIAKPRPPITGPDKIHRLDKIDTQSGLVSVKKVSREGVPYSVLLYERLLGRPYASHRDAVSEEVGDLLEKAVEEHLKEAGIRYHRTRRAERILDFDQAPDFLVPDSTNPEVVIEAKLTEDDGTARDKVTRIQHLSQIGQKRGFEVIACIEGRGFQIRREDMKKLLLATRGKVFTMATLDRLISHTSFKHFVS